MRFRSRLDRQRGQVREPDLSGTHRRSDVRRRRARMAPKRGLLHARTRATGFAVISIPDVRSMAFLLDYRTDRLGPMARTSVAASANGRIRMPNYRNGIRFVKDISPKTIPNACGICAFALKARFPLREGIRTACVPHRFRIAERATRQAARSHAPLPTVFSRIGLSFGAGASQAEASERTVDQSTAA